MKNVNFGELRKTMVEEQLIPRGISNKKVLDAFKKVPRHEFVPIEHVENAYDDYPLPIGEGQTISQPYMAALMTECLGLRGGEKILEIGTGSGYQMAILAEIAKEVYSVERCEGLAAAAGNTMDRLGYKNYKIKVGDGTLGWEEHAPYDGIVVTAGAPGIPESLVKQLRETGRLVMPIGSSFSQVLTVVEKSDSAIKTTAICDCVFVPLVGKDGWANTRMEL